MFGTKKELSRRRITLIAVHFAAACTAGAAAYVAFADELQTAAETTSVADRPIDLERAFWTCDYIGATYGVHAAPVAFCSEVTAELKDRKFGGDFMQMLEWWKRNKATQHSRFESGLVANVSSR